MSCYVYRYIDIETEVIKYVGIACSGENVIRDRVIDHRTQDWYKECDWRIEYFEVNNKSEAEALESHLIALYHTDKWFNTAKTGWGINSFLPTEFNWQIWTDRTLYKDWTGKRFGKLLALRRADNRYTPSGAQRTMWEFQCDCGNIIIADISSCIRCGKTSCGCDTKEKQSKNAIKNFTKHGLQSKNATKEQKKIYGWWNAMDSRSKEFENPYDFYLWVINNDDYDKNKYLLRIDSSLPYSQTNCVLSDHNNRGNGKGNIKMMSLNGDTHSLKEWAELYNIPPRVLYERLHKGFSIERALTQPVQKHSKAA